MNAPVKPESLKPPAADGTVRIEVRPRAGTK